MNKLLRFLATVLAAVVITAAVGCAEPEPADEGEVLEAARELIPAAVEVNRVFFWEGLPHVEPEEESAVDLGDAEYLPLTEDYVFLLESDLMREAEKVYTESFCEDIEEIAFTGVAANDDTALFARYIVEMGEMKINRKLSEEGLSERLPNMDTLKTVELKHDSAVVSVEFTCEEKVEVQNVTLKLEDNGWRLDTPTY